MAWSSPSSIVVNERMDLEKTRFTLQWTLSDCKKIGKKPKHLRSAGITMKELGQDEFQGRWRIVVNPCLMEIEGGVKKSYFGVFLLLTDVNVDSVVYSSDKPVDAEYVVRVITGQETVVFASQRSQEHTFCRREPDWGFPKLVSHDILFGDDKKPGLIKDDSLTVIMEVVMYGEPKAVSPPRIIAADSSKRYQEFARRQADALVSNLPLQSTDFKIHSSDGQVFSTYRLLLMSHSPVFRAMLSHRSKKKRLTRCELDDIDGETVGVLLDYIYGCDTGKVTVSNAEKVLIMADKYELPDLGAVCEEILTSIVTGDNAVHYLVLASQRNLDKLKEAALNVIPKNMGTVLKNGALQEALQFDPDLMQTIMEHCSKKVRLNDRS